MLPAGLGKPLAGSTIRELKRNSLPYGSAVFVGSLVLGACLARSTWIDRVSFRYMTGLEPVTRIAGELGVMARLDDSQLAPRGANAILRHPIPLNTRCLVGFVDR